MPANDLTTLANAQAWVGTSDSVTLPRLITAISTQIQNYLGYLVASAGYAKTFDGKGTDRLYLPDIPVTAVSSLVIGTETIQASTGFAIQGYFLASDAPSAWGGALSICLRHYRFWRGLQNVAVSYTAGFAATPGDLEQACLDWLKLEWAGMDPTMNVGISSFKAGGSGIVYAGRGVVTQPGVIPIPPTILAMIMQYRRVTSPS